MPIVTTVFCHFLSVHESSFEGLPGRGGYIVKPAFKCVFIRSCRQMDKTDIQKTMKQTHVKPCNEAGKRRFESKIKMLPGDS